MKELWQIKELDYPLNEYLQITKKEGINTGAYLGNQGSKRGDFVAAIRKMSTKGSALSRGHCKPLITASLQSSPKESAEPTNAWAEMNMSGKNNNKQ